MSFLGCDHCLDWYACPGPVKEAQDNPCVPAINRGLSVCGGDDFDVATGDGTHGSYIAGACTVPHQTEGQVRRVQEMTGTSGGRTGGGVFSPGLTYKQDKDGVDAKSTFRHKHGHLGQLIIPTRYIKWCQESNYVFTKGIWHNPWVIRNHFDDLYNPCHTIAAIKTAPGVVYPLVNPDETRLHYTFDIDISFDETGLDLSKKGKDVKKFGNWMAIKGALRYMYVNNYTPHIVNTGMIYPTGGAASHFLDAREVNSPTLDITLVIWVPVYVEVAFVPLKQVDFMMDKPRLSVKFKSVKFEYLERRTTGG